MIVKLKMNPRDWTYKTPYQHLSNFSSNWIPCSIFVSLSYNGEEAYINKPFLQLWLCHKMTKRLSYSTVLIWLDVIHCSHLILKFSNPKIYIPMQVGIQKNWQTQEESPELPHHLLTKDFFLHQWGQNQLHQQL